MQHVYCASASCHECRRLLNAFRCDFWSSSDTSIANLWPCLPSLCVWNNLIQLVNCVNLYETSPECTGTAGHPKSARVKSWLFQSQLTLCATSFQHISTLYVILARLFGPPGTIDEDETLASTCASTVFRASCSDTHPQHKKEQWCVCECGGQ